MFLVNRKQNEGKQNEKFTRWFIMEDLDWVDANAQRSLHKDPMFMKFKLDAEGNPKTLDELAACIGESLAKQDADSKPLSTVSCISNSILRGFENKARDLDAEFISILKNNLSTLAQYRGQGMEMCLARRCKLDGDGKPLMVQVRARNTDMVQPIRQNRRRIKPFTA